jgi:hypothetical protein
MQIDLTKAELDIITQLMDFGVKAIGIQAVKPEVCVILDKFGAAIRNANIRNDNKPKEDTLDG